MVFYSFGFSIHELKFITCIDIYEISSKIVKKSFDFPIVPCVSLINSCFANGNFLICWTFQKLYVYIKKLNSSTISYQFPLFLHLTKSLRLSSNNDWQIFLKNIVLCINPFCFRKKCWTITANQRCDMTKTFLSWVSVSLTLWSNKVSDCLSHQLLLHKLYHYDIRSTACDFDKSYLCNRQ